MRELYEQVSRFYFAVATWFLILLAMVLFLGAVWEVLSAIFHREIIGVLEAVGLVIISFAIIETSKFIAEEELLRKKELRSAVELRRSLTKFITIIVIAASLEALVMIFETSRTDVRQAIYPAALFAAAMFALIALGLFQWLSSRIAPAADGGDGRSRRESPKPSSDGRANGRTPMEYRKLGNSGTVVSAYCLGTMTFGDEADEAASHRIASDYAAAGGNFIDTADVYSTGVSEEIVGRWLAANPTEARAMVLATKARFPMGPARTIRHSRAATSATRSTPR